MSPRRHRPYYSDDEALELIGRLLANWVFAQDEHLTEKQQEKKWLTREKAKLAAAIATARDGNYRPLIRLWREERINLSEEAEQLIAEKAIGGAKRSHRHGPAHGKYSPIIGWQSGCPPSEKYCVYFISMFFRSAIGRDGPLRWLQSISKPM